MKNSRLFSNPIILSFVLTALLYSTETIAQTAGKDTTAAALKRRTSFAKSYFGVDVFTLPGGSSQYLTQGETATTDFDSRSDARIVIGGTHFWGHADFYVALPMAALKRPVAGGLREITYNHGVETGFRVLPWAAEAGKVRPFVGVSFKSLNFSQSPTGVGKDRVPHVVKTIFPAQAGLTYSSRKFHVQAVVSHQGKTDLRYPISRAGNGKVSLSPWSFNVGMSYLINTNGGLGSARGARVIKNRMQKLATAGKLDAWYLGVGPSASFEISKSDYVAEKYPYLRQSSPGTLLPDLTAGRYFHKADLNAGISYRRLRYGSEGYGTSLAYDRRSYMLETYKFLGDYHGFVPYVGPTLAFEDLKFTDQSDGSANRFDQKKMALGLIFGWDIRISRSETWLLRTNLRYTPNLHLKAEGKKVMYDQMEFNFIQLVWLVGRRKALQGKE